MCGKESSTRGPGETLSLWQKFKIGLIPYRIGVRKLLTNVGVAYRLVAGSLLNLDHKMTRRERRIVLRTVFDLTKLLPFAIVAAAPGGGFVLPILAKFFPNTLPTTFNMPSHDQLEKIFDASKTQDTFKHQMDSDLKAAMGKLVEKIHENQLKENKELVNLINHAMENPGQSEISKLIYSQFSDTDLLDMLNLRQLEDLAKYFNKPASFFDRHTFDSYRFSILRHLLSRHLSTLDSENVLLQEEGVEKLTYEEIHNMCMYRGLVDPSEKPSFEELTARLRKWLLLSVGKHIPMVIIAFGNMRHRSDIS